MCLSCGMSLPLEELQEHVEECERALFEIRGSKKTTQNLPTNHNQAGTSGDGHPVIDLRENEEIEGEMIEAAIQRSMSATPPGSEATEISRPSRVECSGEEVSTLSGAIQLLQAGLLHPDEGLLCLEVRRDFLVRDAMREAHKRKFNPRKHVKVTFVGEGAIDHGGPRREFFRLLAMKSSQKYCVGKETKKFMDNNVTALQNKEFYHLGQYTAMSITQGGCGFPFLAESVYDYISTGRYTGIEVDIADVPDMTLKFVLEKINDAESDDEIKAVFSIDEAADLLAQTGYRKAIVRLTMADKISVSSALIDYHCMMKVKAALDQYKDGLSELGILSMVQKNPAIWRSMFVSDDSTLTPDTLKNLFIVKYCEKGSQLRCAEEQAYIHFVDFLDECADGDIDCSVEDVLVFFSGSDRVPPLGFEKQPGLTFIHDPKAKFATSSTCNIELRLPTYHGSNYEAFKEDMIFALKGNDGFGGV